MSAEEILRRFRYVTIGYMLIAATLVGGLAVDWEQTMAIRDTQRKTCEIVTSTTSVFVDFIQKEIALRRLREAQPGVPSSTKAFDQAEITYWTKYTLPVLAERLKAQCPE
jgi:hypothetical protein